MNLKPLYLIAFAIGILISSCKSTSIENSNDGSLVGTYTNRRDSSALFRITKDADKYKVAFLVPNKISNKGVDTTDSEPLEAASNDLIIRFFGEKSNQFVEEGWINRDLKFGLFKIKKGVVFKAKFSSKVRSNTGLFVIWASDSTRKFFPYRDIQDDAIRIRDGKALSDENASKLIFSDQLSKIQDSLKLIKVLLNKISGSKYPDVAFSDTLSIDGINCYSSLQNISESDKKYELELFGKFSDMERQHFFSLAAYLQTNFIDGAKKDSILQNWQFIYKAEYNSKNVCGDRFILIENGSNGKSLPPDFEAVDEYQSMYLVKYKPGADCYPLF